MCRTLFLTVGIIILAGIGTYTLTLWKNQRILSLITPTPPANTPFSPTSLPRSEQTTSIANWKTYTNLKYGYSIQYPPDQSIIDIFDGTEDEKGVSSSVEVGLPNTPYDNWPELYIDVILPDGVLNVYNNDIFMQNLRRYIRSMEIGDVVKSKNGPYDIQFIRRDNINVNGNTAYLFEITNFNEKRVVIQHSNILYVIGGYGLGTRFNQILSTFKLISN